MTIKRVNLYILLTCLLILLSFNNSMAQHKQSFVIKWNEPIVSFEQNLGTYLIKAANLYNDPTQDYNPLFNYSYFLPKGFNECDVKITDITYEPISSDLINLLELPIATADTNKIEAHVTYSRSTAIANISFVPIIKDENNNYFKINSFTIDIVVIPTQKRSTFEFRYADNSKLASGNWYKIKLNKTGVYKITYSDMQQMGINMSNVTPNNIKLYGYGGGMLPEKNSLQVFDDLEENAIKVISKFPDKFIDGDYILFYGTSPNTFKYDSRLKHYVHSLHLYDDYTYYFLNCEGSNGLRIQNQTLSTETPNTTSTTFQECLYHESELQNRLSSGKEWIGEEANPINNIIQVPTFNFPNVVANSDIKVRYGVLADVAQPKTANIYCDGNSIAVISFVPHSSHAFADYREGHKIVKANSDKLDVSVKFNGAGADKLWLNYIQVIVTKNLVMHGSQMNFADPKSIGTNKITKYTLSNTNADINIWEVTDPTKVKNIDAVRAANSMSFTVETPILREFIAFRNNDFLSVTFVEKVENQNLHSINNIDMLIIYYEPFQQEAKRLATFHENFDGFRTAIVPVKKIYNEFSSGMQDVSAIRNFIGMLYHRPSEGNKLRYVLLFGDGSFDYKDRIANNTNFIPTFQNKGNVVSFGASTQCDDFFVLLDPQEGEDANGSADVGIGRFPVKTLEEAKIAVDKTIFYATSPKQSLGEWRNKICLVADDQDNNAHINHPEDYLSPLIGKNAPVLNLRKIYLDAYKRVTTASGHSYPDVNTDIQKQISEGILIFNYTGHGGERGLAHEGVLTIPEIKAMTNYNKMPIYMTATCEFAPYDNPEFISAGELVFLNPSGGSPALFTTTRLATTGTNNTLSIAFYDTIFSIKGNELPRFGDVLAYSKAQTGNNHDSKNFILLGDPALQLGIPKLNVATTHINDIAINLFSDTLKAMEKFTLKGIITNLQGRKIDDFNGIVQIQIIDKPQTHQTLGNSPKSPVRSFVTQNNVLYRGLSQVKNGDFEATFIIPKDIDYSFGKGKISYYAYDFNSLQDANGFDTTIFIGGAGQQIDDNQGPIIKLYMDNFYFVSGDKTSKHPLLLAKLSDEQGINTTGNSIGHSITAYLDDDITNIIQLNDYYTADTNTYKSGLVRYKFRDLEVGKHTLTLKAWDILNNSSTASIEFEVIDDFEIEITNVNVYPNPFDQYFFLEFDINLFDEDVDVLVQLVDITGKQVSYIPNRRYKSQGFHIGPIEWRNAMSKNHLEKGVYALQINVKYSGNKTHKGAKLIKF
ncbi:MAG: type IX secretion system sortase PorU [Lentimicrobiaceae bacterium]|nr:type IX secretion system sortase PorU [Lentimicrobiaceae bacterium]